MDWDSPTTKKHIAEAEAQGCELVGKGRDRYFRTYRLPCGHEQEIQPGAMRVGRFQCQTCFTNRLKEEAEAQRCELLGSGDSKGNRTYRLDCGHQQVILIQKMRLGGFRCQTCLANRFKEEAVTQGCLLLGVGRNKNFRIYRLQCGHEQEIQLNEMRRGNFKCQTCFDNKLKEEAEKQGCVLLGAGKKFGIRNYRFSCGHEQEVAIGHMRTGTFRCQTCLDNNLKQEAEVRSCKLLGAGKTCHYRIYRLECGHEQEITTHGMRKGNFRCQTCLDNKLSEEAKAQGCDLLGPGKDANYRTYRLSCGHHQEISLANMRDGRLRCQICLTNKLNGEAKERGCELIGPGRDATYRTYQLPCGHQQEVGTGAMRKASFLCQTCEETFYTLPSQAYLLHIKVGADEWLKLGYAKDIDFRISQYRLPSEADIATLAILPFDTGKEAMKFEKAIHTKFRRKRLRVKDMLNFHTGSGATECYPLTMVEKLMSEMKADT